MSVSGTLSDMSSGNRKHCLRSDLRYSLAISCTSVQGPNQWNQAAVFR